MIMQGIYRQTIYHSGDKVYQGNWCDNAISKQAGIMMVQLMYDMIDRELPSDPIPWEHGVYLAILAKPKDNTAEISEDLFLEGITAGITELPKNSSLEVNNNYYFVKALLIDDEGGNRKTRKKDNKIIFYFKISSDLPDFSFNNCALYTKRKDDKLYLVDFITNRFIKHKDHTLVLEIEITFPQKQETDSDR